MFLYVQTISYSNKHTPIKVLNSMYFGNGMEINMICLIKYSKKNMMHSMCKLLFIVILRNIYCIGHFWIDLS